MVIVTEAAVLTVLAGIWRYLDGRGIPNITAARNILGICLAIVCSMFALITSDFGRDYITVWWNTLILSTIPSVSLIVGYTKWDSWEVMLPRYGIPTTLVGILSVLFVGFPILNSTLYALTGIVCASVYVLMHKYIPNRFSTEISEVVAGSTMIGGLAWLGL